GLSEADREQVAAWTDFVAGEFVVVRYRQHDAIFLDWTEPPKAYAIRPARIPFTELWDAHALPVPVSNVALLPFEGEIVYDGGSGIKNFIFGGSLSADIDDLSFARWPSHIYVDEKGYRSGSGTDIRKNSWMVAPRIESRSPPKTQSSRPIE